MFAISHVLRQRRDMDGVGWWSKFLSKEPFKVLAVKPVTSFLFHHAVPPDGYLKIEPCRTGRLRPFNRDIAQESATRLFDFDKRYATR